MINKLVVLLSLCLVIGCTQTKYPPSEPAPNILPTRTGNVPIYVLAGQSNASGCGLLSELTDEQKIPPQDSYIYMDGTEDVSLLNKWTNVIAGDGGNISCVGPEFGFAQNMPKPCYIIKYTVGGTSMDMFWRSENAGGCYPGYVNLLNTIRNGLDSINVQGHIAGLMWLQGESDSFKFGPSSAYSDRLYAFITDFRHDVGEPDLPVVVAQIHAATNLDYVVAVQNAETEIQYQLPNIATFSTSDLSLIPGTPHFDANSQLEIGSRFAEAMKSRVCIYTSH